MSDHEGKEVMCGCGRHAINTKEAVVYQNQFWKLQCLFYKREKHMPKLLHKYHDIQSRYRKAKAVVFKFTKVKSYMRKQPCQECGYAVGNRWVHIEDAIYCGKCAGQIQNQKAD